MQKKKERTSAYMCKYTEKEHLCLHTQEELYTTTVPQLVNLLVKEGLVILKLHQECARTEEMSKYVFINESQVSHR